MKKSGSLKKIHTKIIIVKRNLELNDLGFLYYSAKPCPRLSGFIYAHLSVFILHFLDITRTRNWWNSKFSKLWQVAWLYFLWYFGTQTGKAKRKWQGTWSMMQWLSLVHYIGEVASVKFKGKTTGELDREGAIERCKQETMKRRIMCAFSLGSSYKQESGQITKDKYIQTLHPPPF